MTTANNIYWIELPRGECLAIAARPRGGDWLLGDINVWAKAGIKLVVSLLEPDEVIDLDLGGEAELCRSNGIDFISFPIADRSTPQSPSAAWHLVDGIQSTIESDKAALIHCRAGIGRSAVIAALVLARFDFDTVRAFDAIARSRGLPVPDTDAQRLWVASLLD